MKQKISTEEEHVMFSGWDCDLFFSYNNCMLKEGKNGVVDFQSPNFVQPTITSKRMYWITISGLESNWVS